MDERSLIDRMRVAWSIKRSGRTVRELRALIRRERPDVVHIHNTFPLISPAVYEVCSSEGVPVVQTLHNYRLACIAGTHFRDGQVCLLCDSTTRVAAIRHRCYRGSLAGSKVVASAVGAGWGGRGHLRFVDRFIVLTEFAADWLHELGVGRDRIVVKPNFFSLPPNVSRSDGGYAVFSGRFAEEKGVMTLLHAWRDMKGFPLLLVGDGPLRSVIERYIAEHALDVRLAGHVSRERAIELVAGARFQVVPSEWFEGLPLTVLEAWGLGVPVLAARIGSLVELVGEDRHGLSFSPGDAADLVRQAKRLIADDTLRQTIAAVALDRVQREFSREHNLHRLERIYRDAIATRVAA
jgi:glycosyltransferase involved in cell wall biosynthesis